MYLKAKYDVIQNVGNTFVKKSDDINSVIGEVKKLLDELENYWSGEDYDNFKSSYLESINKANITMIELNALGHAITKAGIVYSLVDNDFYKEIESMRKRKDEKQY